MTETITIRGRQYMHVKSEETDIVPNKDKVYFLIYHGFGGSMNSELSEAIQESKGTQDYFKNKSLIVDFIYMQGKNNKEGTSSWNIQNPKSKETWNTGSGYANDTLAICLNGTSEECLCETCNGCQWTHCSDDVSFTNDTIAKVISDEAKTGRSEETIHFIAVGGSNGAMFVYLLASSPDILQTYPNLAKIQVFAPVEGNIPFGMFIPQSRDNLKIIDFHGYMDTIVPGKSSYIINNSGKTPNQIPILKDQSSSTDLQRQRQGTLIQCAGRNIDPEIQDTMLQQLHEWGEEWKENINDISDHYASDQDNRQFVYHAIDDILKQVSGNPRQPSQAIYSEEVFATFPSLKHKCSDRIRVDKYNETIYSVETDSKGHYKAMGYGDIFKMCIDLHLKQEDPTEKPGKEPGCKKSSRLDTQKPSKEPESGKEPGGKEPGGKEPGGKKSSGLVPAIIVGIVLVAGFIGFFIYKHRKNLRDRGRGRIASAL